METMRSNLSAEPALSRRHCEQETDKLMQSEHIDVTEVTNNNNNEIDLHDDNGNENEVEENIHMETVRNTSVPALEAAKCMQFGHTDATDVTEITNNNNNEIDLNDENGNQNEEEDLNLGNTSNYTPDERNMLFQRGLEYEKNFRRGAALQCYVGCIQGLKNGNMFAHLPQCLRKIAAIHSIQENYDCTAQITQSENMAYGTTLCEDDDFQQKIDEIAGDNGPGPTDLNELNIDVMRAEEYEHMAKLCWLKKQHHLALEYAGRGLITASHLVCATGADTTDRPAILQCAKLRQQTYGNNHERTKLSLTFFATVYADLRRQQYSGKLSSENDLTESTPKIPEIIMSNPEGRPPVSILRQRSEDGSKETEREKKQVRFHESVDEDLRLREKEEFTSISLTLIQLAVCIVVVASMFMWLYCSLDKSQSCQSLISQFQNWVRMVKHYYRTFFSRR